MGFPGEVLGLLLFAGLQTPLASKLASINNLVVLYMLFLILFNIYTWLGSRLVSRFSFSSKLYSKLSAKLYA